ncbi:MAG: DUF5678 domain-containing protein [Candidatus Rokuibacteriota bacterium]
MTKVILESAATSGLSPEEILQRLDSYGVEWYLTEQGDLMIKYWQVGAEDFVSPERVGTIQVGPVPVEANSLEWVSRHLTELRQEHAGQWVAIVGEQVAAFAPTLAQLLERVGELGIDRPFLTEIPAGPITWITTYYARPFV